MAAASWLVDCAAPLARAAVTTSFKPGRARASVACALLLLMTVYYLLQWWRWQGRAVCVAFLQKRKMTAHDLVWVGGTRQAGSTFTFPSSHQRHCVYCSGREATLPGAGDVFV